MRNRPSAGDYPKGGMVQVNISVMMSQMICPGRLLIKLRTLPMPLTRDSPGVSTPPFFKNIGLELFISKSHRQRHGNYPGEKSSRQAKANAAKKLPGIAKPAKRRFLYLLGTTTK